MTHWPQKPPLGVPLDPEWIQRMGCVLFLPLNDPPGSPIVNDLSGNSRTGTITGATWVAGKFGPCLSFDGNDRIAMGTPAWGNQFTKIVWINPDTPASEIPIMGGNAYATWRLNRGVTYGELRYYDWGLTGGGSSISSNGSTSVGQWQQVTVTYDGAYVRIYVNGVLRGTSAATSGTPNAASWYLGSYNTGYWLGDLDNCCCYNRALTPAEIDQLYREPFAGVQRERLVLWSAALAGGEPGPTYTGSGAGTATQATASAAGTFTVPVYTGTGSPSAASATASASGTFTIPVYTGSGGGTVTQATAAATGTFTVPVYTGTGSPSAAQATASATGTFTVPVYTGAGGGTVTQATASAAGTFTVPVYTGSGGGTAKQPTAAASGLYSLVAYIGSGAGVAAVAVGSASGTFTIPVYSGTGAAAVARATAAATGTYVGTILIYDVYDLQDIEDSLTANYALANDIDATPCDPNSANWDSDEWPGTVGFRTLGSGATLTGWFRGNFDGDGHTVTGLYVNRPTSVRQGVFGTISAGTVQNVTLADVSITGNDYTGGLAGRALNAATIADCHVAGSVTATDWFSGGLIGLASDCTITNCSANCSVTGPSDLGGLVGRQQGGTITACYALGTITATGVGQKDYLGGLVGGVETDGVITDCCARVDITSAAAQVGGLVGNLGNSSGADDGFLVNCYAAGAVTGNSDVGGLVGRITAGSTAVNCFWDTETSGQATSAAGTGKTTAEMKDDATFTDEDTVGLDTAWDFVANPHDDVANEEIWSIGSLNDGYPYLTDNPVPGTGVVAAVAAFLLLKKRR